MSDCPWRQHGFCGVSGKRLWRERVHVLIHIHAQGTAVHQEHPWTEGALVSFSQCGTSRCVGSFSSRLFFPPQAVKDGCRMVRGPAEPCGFWGPRTNPPCTGKKTPPPASASHWPHRLLWHSAQDGMSSSPEDSRSRGGGSDRDSKKASSSNTTPEGGPPPLLHQSRIRQVGVCPSAASVARSAVERLSSARCRCCARRLSGPRRWRAAAINLN